MSEPVAKAILLCNFGIQDRQNRWSLIGMFDTMQFPALPALWPPFFVFARICDVPKKGSFLAQVEDPSGMVVWTSGPAPYDIASDERTTEQFVRVPSAIVTAFGRYRVVFFVNSDRVAETDLFMKAAEAHINSA